MTVEDFMLGLDGQQKAIVSFLHHRLINDHNLIPKIRYNIPMYYRKSWVCYLNPIKNDGIELVFLKGNELSNSQGLLQNKGRKVVAGIDMYDVQIISERAIDEIVQEALILEGMEKSRH